MKEIILVMTAILGISGGIAAAQTVEQLDKARGLVMEKQAADAVKGATAEGVEGINVRVDMKAPEGAERGPRRGGAQTDVVIKPGDPEFAAVLAAAKAAMARKATAVSTELEAVKGEMSAPAVEPAK